MIFQLHLPSLNEGRLAQLVQSTSFTPRGSGVRIPHRPQQKKLQQMLKLFLFNQLLL